LQKFNKEGKYYNYNDDIEIARKYNRIIALVDEKDGGG